MVKLQSHKSLLNSVTAQVNAAEIANEGIAAEYERGLGRTTLRCYSVKLYYYLMLKLSLANSERNYLLAQFNLLKALVY